jgi:hypothetical protein
MDAGSMERTETTQVSRVATRSSCITSFLEEPVERLHRANPVTQRVSFRKISAEIAQRHGLDMLSTGAGCRANCRVSASHTFATTPIPA